MQEGRHEVWLREKAGIIAEIEVYWLFPWERFNQNWFPDLIFYEANADLVEQREEELIKEEEEKLEKEEKRLKKEEKKKKEENKLKKEKEEEKYVQKIDGMTNEITTLKKEIEEMAALLKNVLQPQAIAVATCGDSSRSTVLYP
ncbi:hypothetical protein BC936DRAFT_137553 [Jimgerdemannia flammicorona]|uniref:Uncharacterized protein n=1 Tax=Jimgerdemannia flammicorona TaxID=994334 RepID=A0A433CX38_9FUNG|nr:hypothetical protein BC936DRAFT_137553 [Jimgerdemannia flammicorona]